ncbi:MAG TPA: alpha/beta fold hydrolase [Gemmatimonadaceae bacterium]|jgi:phospholipase/carboxylesterase
MQPPRINRRGFVAASVSTLLASWSCTTTTQPRTPDADELVARPGTPSQSLAAGQHALGIGVSRFPGILPARDGILYLPSAHTSANAIPLLILLHGSGGEASDWFGSYLQRAELHQFAMLAIDSRDDTWDLLTDGHFGADVRFIDQALGWTFNRVRVDAQRVALVGFSDGASYALSLGISNGGLFSRIVACSGCAVLADNLRGKPAIFASHGVEDDVLPIAQCARTYVPALRAKGYSVEYQEFEGGHELPDAVSTSAMSWLDTSWKT